MCEIDWSATAAWAQAILSAAAIWWAARTAGKQANDQYQTAMDQVAIEHTNALKLLKSNEESRYKRQHTIIFNFMLIIREELYYLAMQNAYSFTTENSHVPELHKLGDMLEVANAFQIDALDPAQTDAYLTIRGCASNARGLLVSYCTPQDFEKLYKLADTAIHIFSQGDHEDNFEDKQDSE